MKRLAARLVQAIGILLICACAMNATVFFTRADDSPKHGDLNHLQFTATGELPVTLVYPKDGTAVSGPATQVTAQTVNGAGVELQVNGEVVSSHSLGRMSVSKDGTTVFDYYGILLHPGPNTIIATAVGANGLRGKPEMSTVFGPGPAVSVKLSMLGDLIADGKSQARLVVDAVDRWNHPAMSGAEVDMTILSGKAIIANSSDAAPFSGAQATAMPSALPISASSQPQAHFLLGQGGRVLVPIVASLEPGTLQVRAAIGDASDSQTFTIAPYLRKAFVNGLISVGAGSVPVAVDGTGRYDGGGARKERIGVFASGKVGRASSLTFSFESQNRLQQSSSFGPYTVDPNERPYQTYGDASTVTSDFHSNSRFYARIDNGRNNAMVGQYDVTVGDPGGIAHYQQQLSGAKAELALGGPGRGKILGFTAHNTVGYASFSVPVTGLASLLQPLHADIVLGSDILTLVSLDRSTGRVVTQTQLTRNVDYTIDYATGTVRFLNIPLPFDVHFNPQVLQVQYQYQGAGVASETTGFNFDYALRANRALRFNAGYLNNSSGASNYSLATATLSAHTTGGDWMLSHANSAGVVPGVGIGPISQTSNRGSATSFTMNQRIVGSQVTFNYQNVGPGFANPFGGFTVTGLESMTATFSHQVQNRDALNISVSQQRNTGATRSSQQTFIASWQHLITNALSVTLGLQSQHQTNVQQLSINGQNTPQIVNGTATQMTAGLRWKPHRRIGFDIEHQASLGGNAQVLPAQTSAEFDYEFPQQGKIFLREMFGGAVSSFAQSTQSYTAPALSTRSTQIGLERVLGNTTIDTTYAVANAGNATNIYSTLGIQETFKFGKRLSGNATMQNARAMGSGASGFTVFGTGLTYTDLKDFRATFSMQSRGGLGGGTTLNAGAVGHIGPNIALLGSASETFASGVSAVQDRVSIAYRPAQNDRFISLVGLDRQSGGYTLSNGTSDILSFEEIFRPTPATEVVGRFGYKLNGDGYYLAHSSVAGLRVTQAFGPRFDIAAEVRQMAVGNIAGARSTDFASELGYRIGGGTRLAAGYNFSGSVDPTLTGHPQRKGLYVTVTTLVDRIFGWGKP